MTNLSIIQCIGLTSCIKKDNKPTIEYMINPKIEPKINVIINVGMKINRLTSGIPTNKHIAILPIVLITINEYIPCPITL